MVTSAIYITVPLLLEALSQYLNQPYEKLQEYYETSKAFRDYITSLTRDFDGEIRDKIANTTPSTTPRFDVPWILAELKKKQQEIFNIKRELAANEIAIEQATRAEYVQPPKFSVKGKVTKLPHREGPRYNNSHYDVHKHQLEEFKKKHGYTSKKEFLAKKAEDIRQGNIKTIQLNHKLQQVTDRHLQNKDPRYQSYTERINNAQQKKTHE